ncbi:hypothetical protein OsJ_31993 [Oryza sativa Japonica Group]|nr:hypothetical protein OsJ_31993 [Oryza sativa Japonica Group]
MSGITEDFWLRYDGKQMDEVGSRTLADYGIHDPATEMEIFVRGLMGNTRTLWVKPSDTVKSVKGWQLKDGDTLASCGIWKYSNMNLCYHFADSCDCICAHIETQRLIQKHQTLAQLHSTQPATEMQIYVKKFFTDIYITKIPNNRQHQAPNYHRIDLKSEPHKSQQPQTHGTRRRRDGGAEVGWRRRAEAAAAVLALEAKGRGDVEAEAAPVLEAEGGGGAMQAKAEAWRRRDGCEAVRG